MYSGGKMPNILWKNFHLCFSKIKCLPTTLSPPPTIEEDENFVPNDSNKNPPHENFDYVHDLTSNSTSKSSTTEHFFSSDSGFDSGSIPDLSTILTSQRFFFSTPGRSNSIIESPDGLPLDPDGLVSGGVAIQTYSANPYADFRRSMQEMVEARELTDVKANWEMLHELLLCYLTLNPKHTHKFIVDAFADLIISLMSSTAATLESCLQV